MSAKVNGYTFADYCIHVLKLRPGTVKLYVALAKRWTREGHRDGRDWLSEQIGSARCKAQTLTVYRAAVMAWCRWQDLEFKTKTEMPRREKWQQEYRQALSEGQLSVFMKELKEAASWMPESVRVVLFLLPYTGMRIGEAVGLRSDSFKRRNGAPGIQPPADAAKGGKLRWIPLLPEADEVLTQWRARARETIAACPTEDGQSTYIFPSPVKRSGQPCQPITTEHVRQQLSRLIATHAAKAKERGTPADQSLERISPHVFRHTFATLLLKRGVGVVEVAELLGHADVRTTARYLHPDAQTLANSVAKLGDLSAPTEGS